MPTYRESEEAFFKKTCKRLDHDIALDIIKLVILGLLVLGVLAMLLWPAIAKTTNIQTYKVTVQDKGRVGGDKDGKYLIYCLDSEGNSKVFEVTDSLFKLRFNSADTYNLIQVGETYTFTAGGYRIPFFSMYPNIYEMTKEEPADGSNQS